MAAQLRLLVAFLVVFVAKQTESVRTCSNSKYLQLGLKCYRTFLEPGKNYDKAKSLCEADGGRLAMMSTPVEALSVLSSIDLESTWSTLRPYHRLWIGLHDRTTENKYEWADGEGTNNPVGWDDCGQVSQYMRWIMRPCRDVTTKGFVCEMVTECPSGGSWSQTGSKCFYMERTTTKVKYFKAQGLCRVKHPQSNLAKIESWSEMHSIINMMVEGGFKWTDKLWFGATDFLSEGSFIYPDGSVARPLSGSHVFKAKNEHHDFALLKINSWLTQQWNFGYPNGFVCSIDLVIGKPLSCASGWVLIGEYCFKAEFTAGYVSRQKAMEACSALQSDSVLASFRLPNTDYLSFHGNFAVVTDTQMLSVPASFGAMGYICESGPIPI
ncbi:hypothetical protein CAPTEDRAFT_201170 [Capitella teleta]|uniref:C-type lectin domain-containing protein n=1 Tax=Capitella teleta TaxID=283909 RepID=R7VAX3_CAPTE|nr:hypothetical protein CAPTEDRAFT_201170 [Capitella teleta]|eukprot:ELU15749.1 hypothetical protein CAPTEDRAFT_201170 [Capitella teleta]